MPKFILVFNKEDKDKLLSNGYRFINEDTVRGFFVFENKVDTKFALNDVKHICLNTMRF